MSPRHKSPHRGAPCKDCGHTMRLYTDNPEEHPDTVKHYAAGVCSGCVSARRKAERKELAALYAEADRQAKLVGTPGGQRGMNSPLIVRGHQDADPNVRADAHNLQAWLDDRRSRNAPTAGAHMEGDDA